MRSISILSLKEYHMEILVLVVKFVVGAAIIGFFGKFMWTKYQEMKQRASGPAGVAGKPSDKPTHLE